MKVYNELAVPVLLRGSENTAGIGCDFSEEQRGTHFLTTKRMKKYLSIYVYIYIYIHTHTHTHNITYF
jgi:hypothetical protein